MLIQVEYRNRRYDMVQDYYLEALLAAGKISRFFRRDGWVEVGHDALRTADTLYVGTERRRPMAHRPLQLPVRLGGKKILPVFGGDFRP